MWKIVVLTGLAGGLGTILRFGATKGCERLFAPGFPWGTLAVNVMGAFLAGVLFVCCREKLTRFEIYFPVLFLGFLGGFTTFSTFALESMRYVMDAQYSKFLWNVAAQNGLGLLAAWGGLYLGKCLFHS